MTQATGAVILFSFAASVLAAGSSAASQKPVVTQEVFVVVPGTLDEMFRASDEVIDVQILSSTVRGVGNPTNPYVTTFYTAKILRSRKGTTSHGQVVFTQAAGELEVGDHILRANGEPLKIGERYIVFLRLNEAFGGRILVGGRSGAFKIKNGHIDPQGFGKLAEEQRNLTERAFADELDRLSRRSISKE